MLKIHSYYVTDRWNLHSKTKLPILGKRVLSLLSLFGTRSIVVMEMFFFSRFYKRFYFFSVPFYTAAKKVGSCFSSAVIGVYKL